MNDTPFWEIRLNRRQRYELTRILRRYAPSWEDYACGKETLRAIEGADDLRPPAEVGERAVIFGFQARIESWIMAGDGVVAPSTVPVRLTVENARVLHTAITAAGTARSISIAVWESVSDVFDDLRSILSGIEAVDVKRVYEPQVAVEESTAEN